MADANPTEKFFLSLSTRTWSRDSHGLFDYESEQTRHLNAILDENIYIGRKKHEILPIKDVQNFNQEDEILFEIKHEHNSNKYILDSPVPIKIEPTQKNINDLSNKIWYILKNDPLKSNNSKQMVVNTNDDYYLCKNDVIKLGRVKYSINEINIPSRGNNIEAVPPLSDIKKYDIDNLNKNTEPVFNFIFNGKDASEYNDIPDDEKICKICYSDENNRESNPLVHLCNCNGGLRFSHFMCIKKWMETKLLIKENDKKTVKCYFIKSFNCEICKTPYPFKFKLTGIEKPFELIDLQKPIGRDYIILESLNQVKDNCNIKCIHVIQLNNDDLIIGRGHESDIRINDISVSRNHAKLKYNQENGTILLRDLKSKFGTLVLIKKPLEIKEKKIHIQIGRTYIECWLMSLEELNKLREEKRAKSLNKQKHQSYQNQGKNIDNNINKENKNMDIEENNQGGNTFYPK